MSRPPPLNVPTPGLPRRAVGCDLAEVRDSYMPKPAPHESPAPHAAHKEVSTVYVHVRRLGQLFNSLDPAPFWERDLDPSAGEFIEDEFSDKPRDRAWVLEVSTEEDQNFNTKDVQSAVTTYYQRMVTSASKKIRDKLWIGQWALLIGVAVFLACMLLRGLLEQHLASGPPRLLDEGLIVLAWVALWIPVEQFFYDLAPLFRERRFYRRLTQVRVHVRHIAPARQDHPG